MSASRREILEEEWLIVRHSGEIPEIALHSALYFLTEDPLGPCLQLSAEEIESLQDAAICRYQEIIMRDLCYENRNLSIYRGVRRAIVNWHRFVTFCERQDAAALARPEGARHRSLQERIERNRRTNAEAFLQLVQESRQQGEPTALACGRPSSIPGACDTGPSLACGRPSPIPGACDTGPSLACGRPSSIPGACDTGPSLACVFNCTSDELSLFVRELGLTGQLLVHDIDHCCDRQKNHQHNDRSTEYNEKGEYYALCEHPGGRQVKQDPERKYL